MVLRVGLGDRSEDEEEATLEAGSADLASVNVAVAECRMRDGPGNYLITG